MLHRILAPWLLLCSLPLTARQGDLSCGANPFRWMEELHLHRQSAALGELRARASHTPPRAQPDIGDIAVIGDADGVVARRNPFNLQQRTLRFIPSGRLYSYGVAGESYDSAAAAAGRREPLGDDDFREIALPFPFPFYGRQWSSVFVNSDGNLTFDVGDASLNERSIGKIAGGPPRIAALFRDLDPTRARDGIRVLSESGRFVVSWSDVPEFQDAGTGPLQTFQLRLYPDGRIEIAYSRVTTQQAIAGISPGRLERTLHAVSFAAGSQTLDGSILERFSSSEEVDIFTASEKFLETHADAYDFIVLFNTLNIPAGPATVAFETPIRSNRSGYGDDKVDIGLEAGSRRRLQAILNMGPLSQYPLDPFARVPGRGNSGDTTLSVLAHEAGHMFLAYASVRDASNPDARPMLSRDLFHWAFTFNSEASLMEGNRIRDNGAGVSPRFTTVASVEGFSPLDLYLMGALDASAVPDTFAVERATVSNSRIPEPGVNFDGTRRDISIREIIAAEGRRTPDHTVSQRTFRFAFVLITDGSAPAPAQISQVDRYRTEFERYFNRVTGDRMRADATLKRTVYVTPFPAAGVIQNRPASFRISVDELSAAPIAVRILARNGVVDAPGAVTIPSNVAGVSFEVLGTREGVEELVFEPADPRWETVDTRVRVQPASRLRWQTVRAPRTVEAGGSYEILIRLTDENDLPYPNVAIGVRASSGAAAGGPTDELGFTRILWTPQQGGAQSVTVSVEGGPTAVVSAGPR